jgi:hypothetical protein
MRQVLPLAPEGVTNRDGTEKQDCELNAAKRLLVKLRKTHPKLSFVAVGDGLHSNQPFITLSMVFFILNLLAFYIHQILELTDRYFHSPFPGPFTATNLGSPRFAGYAVVPVDNRKGAVVFSADSPRCRF